jgi:RimJ/RimL family protein N-acetyltransferase
MDWGWMMGALRSREDVDRRIADGLKAEEKNEEYAFAVVLKRGGRVVGSTSYLGIVLKHKSVEIGATWYSADVQGTAVNPECKLLLLKHAFEDWGAVRVQLKTDINNTHSQRAILKLGAKFEGRLRNHGIRPDGTIRDAMLYSMIPSEWPTVKKGLEARIENFARS